MLDLLQNVEHGEKLKGSKGNFVRFIVFPGIHQAEFTVKGRPDEGPLNVISLRVNDVEVCENAKQVCLLFSALSNYIVLVHYCARSGTLLLYSSGRV